MRSRRSLSSTPCAPDRMVLPADVEFRDELREPRRKVVGRVVAGRSCLLRPKQGPRALAVLWRHVDGSDARRPRCPDRRDVCAVVLRSGSNDAVAGSLSACGAFSRASGVRLPRGSGSDDVVMDKEGDHATGSQAVHRLVAGDCSGSRGSSGRAVSKKRRPKCSTRCSTPSARCDDVLVGNGDNDVIVGPRQRIRSNGLDGQPTDPWGTKGTDEHRRGRHRRLVVAVMLPTVSKKHGICLRRPGSLRVTRRCRFPGQAPETVSETGDGRYSGQLAKPMLARFAIRSKAY